MIKISILCLFALACFSYSRYLYKVDLFVLIVPLNYKGKVELNIGYLPSPIKVGPIDGMVYLQIDEDGKFSTNSNFEVSFNRIVILEKSGESVLVDKKLHFVNKNYSTKKDSLNRNYTIIEGEIVGN